MKTKPSLLFAAISLFTINIDAQIKLHSGGGISIGSTDYPGDDIISLDNPTEFSDGLSTDAINLPDLELTTSTDFLDATTLLCDFSYGYYSIKSELSAIKFSTVRSFYKFDEEILVQSTYYYSDINLKENVLKIKESGPSLERIKMLEGITYNLKDDKDKLNYAGFSAQDLQKVFPDLVEEYDDGVLAVNYTGLIPYLVEALKEQEARIKALEDQLIEMAKFK